MMKKMLFIAAVVAAISYGTVRAAKPVAGTSPEQAPVAAAAGGTEVRATAEVLKVDKMSRTVTVRNAEGEKVKIKVPREAGNLDQLKPGSMLSLRYTQAAAVAIGKTGATEGVEDETVVAQPDSTSGQTVLHNRFVVGKIQDVDLDKRELKVKASDDEIVTLHVAPGVTGFEDAKIGDTAAIRFTEAAAISLMPQSQGRKSGGRQSQPTTGD